MWRSLQTAAARERNSIISSKTKQLSALVLKKKTSFFQHHHHYHHGTNSIPRAFSTTSGGAIGGGGTGTSPDVAIQLDYFMSLQFAGIATALVNNLYQTNGISHLHFLPTCPVGHELSRVRSFQNNYPSTLAIFGSVEQNIFTITLHENPELDVTGVASMFRRSPLCVASLGSNGASLKEGDVIGAHEDTVELLSRIFPKQQVVASPRGTKNMDLLKGVYQGIQAYTTTEVPALYRLMKEQHQGITETASSLVVTPLEGSHGDDVQLGYSQMLFVANECLQSNDRREAATAFLEATFQGWQMAIRNPDDAIRAVAEAQKMLKLDDESNDHWHDSFEFQREMLELCNNHVKESFSGDRLGVLHEDRWGKATKWLLEGKKKKNGDGEDVNVDPLFGLDTTGLWQSVSQSS